MAKKEHIVRYTAEELQAMSARGEDRTDWVRAGATTQAELETQVASDPDEAGMIVDWASASVELPKPKSVLNIPDRYRCAGVLSPARQGLSDQDQCRSAVLFRAGASVKKGISGKKRPTRLRRSAPFPLRSSGLHPVPPGKATKANSLFQILWEREGKALA